MPRRQASLPFVLATSLLIAGCGSSAPNSDSDREIADDRCGTVEATSAGLADAQFAFIGTVIDAHDEVHPWTTDPENPDRPDVATTARWVTFEVEGWYTADWGPEFSVWMPTFSVDVGDRAAVAGDAYQTEVDDFTGQSGEVELCTPLTVDGDARRWADFFGEVVAPGPVVPTTRFEDRTIGGSKVFGEQSAPCPPTVLRNREDDQAAVDAGSNCFLDQIDAGRPVVWDLAITTEEGGPIPLRYDFDGATVRITRDDTHDPFGSGGVTEQQCTSVRAVPGRAPEGVGCTSSPGDGFLADSLP